MVYKQDSYMGCLGKTRPVICLRSTPTKCCFNCKDLVDCYEQNTLNGSPVLPCTSNVIEEHEVCEMAC